MMSKSRIFRISMIAALLGASLCLCSAQSAEAQDSTQSTANQSDTVNTNTVRKPLTRGPASMYAPVEVVKEREHILDNFYLTMKVKPSTGEWSIQEKLSNPRGGEIWRSGKSGFGNITYQIDDKTFTQDLTSCEAALYDKGMMLTFRPVPNIADMNLIILAMPSGSEPSLTFTIHPSKQLNIKAITLFENAFPITSEDTEGSIIIPVREGMLVPADSGKTFTRNFADSAYEGCHIRLWGMIKNETAAFLTWDDPYTNLKIDSQIQDGIQTLSTSLSQQSKPAGFSIYFCGRGDYNTIADRYLQMVAKKKETYIPWSKKAAENPARKALFGATNFKLWSVLDRRMDEQSQKEVSVKVNWTFEEAGKVAQHLKNDLKMDDVLFTMGGWIHRGYDNQHPDILPAAPECGGNWGLLKAVWDIQNAGYTACLHDNYQDMYKDAPSWDEKYLSKNLDGSIKPGGIWAGGRPYLTCSKASLELASRPQNLSEVLKVSQARSYFIDTTYAANLMDCYDKSHPIDYYGDIEWRCRLSDYARSIFGIFGSEDGREWAIPHADFFEGIAGVAGSDFHTFKIEELGAVMLPIFEMIYHDCIAAYGKYGYDIHKSAPFVLRHIALGRPMYHHSVPPHLYWETEQAPAEDNPALEAIFTRSKGGWMNGKHTFDVFVKNTHEILSPYSKIAAEMKLTRFDYLTPDKQVTRSVFQGNGKTIVAIVNYGTEPYHSVSITSQDYRLPQYGFLIESEEFIAFNASLYNGVEYAEPVLFTLRSQDKLPIWESASVKVYHGFGSPKLRIKTQEYIVETEAVISTMPDKKNKGKNTESNEIVTQSTEEDPSAEKVIIPAAPAEQQDPTKA